MFCLRFEQDEQFDAFRFLSSFAMINVFSRTRKFWGSGFRFCELVFATDLVTIDVGFEK